MLIRVFAACALLLPGAALAQARPAQPVTVEVIATGEIDGPASSLTMSATWVSEGATQADADRAKIAKLADVLKALLDAGVPNAAISELAADDPARVSVAMAPDLMGLTETAAATEGAADAGSVELPAPLASASDGKSIRVTSLAQANSVRAALQKIDVTVSDPVAELDDQPAVFRQAKAKALRNARLDADVYAKEMGLRVVRISRISEAGNNLMLPSLQDKFQRVFSAGPNAMKDLFKSKPGTVHVEATIVVEFVLAP